MRVSKGESKLLLRLYSDFDGSFAAFLGSKIVTALHREYPASAWETLDAKARMSINTGANPESGSLQVRYVITTAQYESVKSITGIKGVDVAPFVKEMLFKEVTRGFLAKEWNQAFKDPCPKTCLALIPIRLTDGTKLQLFLSDLAIVQLSELGEEKQSLILGWLYGVVEECGTPFAAGRRLDNKNKSQWVYELGKTQILAYIKDHNIIILDVITDAVKLMKEQYGIREV